jgi:apolipoprotein N-acyltransferase
MSYYFINSLLGFIGFFLIFILKKKDLFYFGFFVGIFWFWWIVLASRYYDLFFLMPFIFVILIGLVYGFIFYALSWLSKDGVYLKAILLFFIDLIHPFGFNWFEPKLVLLESFFSINDFQYFSFLIALAILSDTLVNKNNKTIKLMFSLFLLLIVTYKIPVKEPLNNDFSNIKIISTKISQDEREKSIYYIKALNFIFKEINIAISQNKELIIFPETILPIYFNTQGEYERKKLKKLSKNIKIIIGSLYMDKIKNKKYNSIYYYNDTNESIFHKKILTPLGEKNPLFKSANKLINNLFYNGAIDFSEGNTNNYININDKNISLAICYEATSNESFYKKSNIMIAISNNSWFYPSTQNTFQNLLLKLYSKKYKTIILHSANYGREKIIF